MEKVRSKDGSYIAFETLGSGPPVVLVGGAFCDRRARTAGLPLARALAPAMTVYCYDRRGRGESDDTPPYAVAREIEDLSAVLEAAGGSPHVYGHSSGAILVLESALAGVPVARLALYEPPLVLGDLREPIPPNLAAQLAELAAAGKRSDAVELFLTLAVGVPAQAVQQRKSGPVWPILEALAHTLSYDARLTAEPASIVARAAGLRAEATLFDGAKSQPWMLAGVQQLARAMPHAGHVTLPEQTHDVDPQQLAPKLLEFFLA